MNDATKDALRVLRAEATRLRREGIDAQIAARGNPVAEITAAHLCAASGRLLATARRIEEGAR